MRTDRSAAYSGDFRNFATVEDDAPAVLQRLILPHDSMVMCQRRGCGAEFDPTQAKTKCIFHPGAPVFHEGLKSWSCCKERNKPVLEFDQFLQIAGCAEADGHTQEKQALPEPEQKKRSEAEKAAEEALASVQLDATPLAMKAAPAAAPKAPKPVEEAQDPESMQSVPAESRCRRTGCGYTASADVQNRDRTQEDCRYHPGVAVFHEGSKGYMCCKRRVLDFDDFLGIEPCTKAKHGHLFADVQLPQGDTVQCRIDHYETPADVRVTVYAKGVIPEESSIAFEQDRVEMSLCLAPTPSIAQKRRFVRTLQPFSAIDPAASSFSIGKMKVDMVLVKAESGISWPTLERSDQVHGYGLTFGRSK